MTVIASTMQKMANAEDLIARYTGHDVPVSFNPAFIVLSYVVSLLGAGSTLELINRRTSLKGIHNHVLLVGAAISMGGIAIWAMHFIAYRAIVLLDGQEDVQIAYSAGVTTASFFVPIFVLLLAFVAVSSNDVVRWWRVVLAGALSGGAICGMHYLGDASISNYRCHYEVANVAGAASIAVAAATVALSLFFKFRESWTNSWVRRLGCTVLMSTAAAGMHWCASLGTHYTMLSAAVHSVGSNSRNTTTIIVICLAVAASGILVTMAILTARRMRGYAHNAQEIVLAAAVFDKQGRILVSPDGLLPSETVTDMFPQRTYDDVLSTAHPLFQWMFRASRNWSGIATLLPWMTTHIDPLPRVTRGRSGIRLVQENGQLVDNYDIIFRELFCLAASSLASKMGEDITNLGMLWDEIFHTGNATKMAMRMSSTFDIVAKKEAYEASGLEAGSVLDSYGRGSLMFLVRHVEKPSDISKLEAAGYRFADTSRVVDIISTCMQIKTRHLESKLRDMAAHSELDGVPVPGVHVVLFAVRARLDKYGFDVLVDGQTRKGLPTVELPYKRLAPWQMDVLKQVDGLPLQTLLIRLAAMPTDSSPRDIQFAAQLRAAVAKLRADLDDASIDKATISAQTVQMPCLPTDAAYSSTTSTSPTCTAIALQVVFDINNPVRCNKCDFVPLQFFKVHQLVRANSSHHNAFSRALHRDVASVLTMTNRPSSSMSARMRGHSHSSSTTNLCTEPETEEKALEAEVYSVRMSSSSAFDHQPLPPPETDQKSPAYGKKPSPLGGIMVSQEIAVEVREVKQAEETTKPHIATTITKGLQNAPSKSVLKKPSSTRLSVAEQRGPNPATRPRGIELGRVNRSVSRSGSPTTTWLGGFHSITVDATEKQEDTATFVDDLFASCIERRR